MSEPRFDPESRKSPGKPSGIGATIFLILFAIPFAGFGVAAIVQGINKLASGWSKDGLMLCVVGLVFSVFGFGMIFGVIWGRKKMKQTEEAKARYADKPWMLRADWAAGRIKSSAPVQAKLLAFMGSAFCGVGGIATYFALQSELPKGNYAALLALVFPVAGMGLLIAAARGFLAQRRFGECFFEPALIPARLGGTLEGMIKTGARIRLEHGLQLKISCIRRTTTGSGDNHSTQELVLWQGEKTFKPGIDLPELEPGHTSIPVFFKLPADQPEATAGLGDGIYWRLSASSKMSGPDFSAAFDVPVFKVPGLDAVQADKPDPTAGLQEPAEELRRDEHSKIQVTDGPNGREFYFPAARNLGSAIGLSIFFLVWTACTLAAHLLIKSLFFAIVFSIVDALIFLGCVNLWLKSSRVTINSTTVTAVNRWLIFSRTRQFDAADIVRFACKPGMQSGNRVFQNITLILREDGNGFAANKAKYQSTGQTPPLRFRISSPGGITVASSIASITEANWLVAEMNKALGRK